MEETVLTGAAVLGVALAAVGASVLTDGEDSVTKGNFSSVYKGKTTVLYYYLFPQVTPVAGSVCAVGG